MEHTENKKWQNQTTVSEFTLLGFGDSQKIHVLLFLFFLVIYLAAMVGNLLIVFLVVTDRHLHTPMYFFLGNLSFLESCCSSTVLPKMLSNLLMRAKGISVTACFVQFFTFALLGGTECYLLAMMSCDRYLAICKPLHYTSVMNAKLSFQLSAVSWACGILVSTSITVKVTELSFCGSGEIDHFFCDVIPDIRYISCSDTHLVELQSFIYACVFTFPPFALTLSSYVVIIATILRIPSTSGRRKAFSTCSSHLTVVALYYGTLMLVYLLPHSRHFSHIKKAFSLFYTVMTPILNPLIYSLRNKEVKDALSRACRKLIISVALQKVSFLKLHHQCK